MMIEAPIPSNEPARLVSLHELDILTNKSDRSLDELTELASAICNTPVSLVTLIDGERQFFKSRVGLDIQETPRSISFCAHAILNENLMVVEDATKDERFHDNPIVTGPLSVRFYAGYPIITLDQQHLGTLCVVDVVPRKLNDHQRLSLKSLAHQAAIQLDLIRHIKRLASKNSDLQAIMSNISLGIFSISKDLSIHADQSAWIDQILEVQKVRQGDSISSLLSLADLSRSKVSFIESTFRNCFGSTPDKIKSILEILPQELSFINGKVVEVQWDPIYKADSELERILVTLRDVTLQRSAVEQRIMLSEKMALLGDLVFDLGHELRNAQILVHPNLENEKKRFSVLLTSWNLEDFWLELKDKLFNCKSQTFLSTADYNQVVSRTDISLEYKKLHKVLLQFGVSSERRDLLGRHFLKLTDAQKKELLAFLEILNTFNTMWIGAQRTVEITSSILDQSRQDLEILPSVLQNVIKSVLILLQKRIRNLGIQVKFDELPQHSILFRQSDLNQILVNLAKNSLDAFENQKPSSKERILVFRVEQIEDRVVLYIEDNAGGIPPELIDKIFERRFSTKGKAGNGLGLSISQKLAEKNSSTLVVKSEAGRTIFGLSLLLESKKENRSA